MLVTSPRPAVSTQQPSIAEQTYVEDRMGIRDRHVRHPCVELVGAVADGSSVGPACFCGLEDNLFMARWE